MISTTSVQLLYILKIDTTGLAPLPAPSGRLTIMFLSYLPQHMPKLIPSLRIHIFACAARAGRKVVSSNWAQSFPLSELIPAFNNDPKARFLHLIGNCSTNPSVEPVIGIVNELKLIMFPLMSYGIEWEVAKNVVMVMLALFLLLLYLDHQLQIQHQSLPQRLIMTNRPKPLQNSSAPPLLVKKMCKVFLQLMIVAPYPPIHSKDYSKLENLTKDGWIANVKSSINSAILEDHLKKQRKLYKKLNNTTNDDDNNKKIDGEVLLMNDKNKKVTNEGKTDPSSSSGFLDFTLTSYDSMSQ
ncbi:hypothetical protein MJO28_003348 [Puccinia striiformis f. sp. tritici]|uniref:Uncharacterized protein n=1 Tax=Puccinia striiformis f. sp. tritici TaxID=168172 RepID=A0ACC0EUQ7_9BASI|nr:hypothetical protein MJO28_003348 [Puccinia striiformis f. sp. tritici]